MYMICLLNDICVLLCKENMCLKKEVLEKSSQVEEQNHKIGELSGQNKRCPTRFFTLQFPAFQSD